MTFLLVDDETKANQKVRYKPESILPTEATNQLNFSKPGLCLAVLKTNSKDQNIIYVHDNDDLEITHVIERETSSDINMSSTQFHLMSPTECCEELGEPSKHSGR